MQNPPFYGQKKKCQEKTRHFHSLIFSSKCFISFSNKLISTTCKVALKATFLETHLFKICWLQAQWVFYLWYSWSPLITVFWLSFLCVLNNVVFSSPSTRLAHKPLQIGPRRTWGIYNQDHNIIFNKVSSSKVSHLKLDTSLSSSRNDLPLLLFFNSWL